MKRLLNFALVAILMALCSGWALADPISPTSLIVGDKLFSNFSITATGGLTIPDNSVTISPLVDSDLGVYGILIGSGLFSTNLPLLDIQFMYTVQVLENNPRTIVGIAQAFNLTATGSGGTLRIGETVYDGPPAGGGQKVAQSTVSWTSPTNNDFEDPAAELVQGDDLVIDPGLKKVWVTKDIRLEAADRDSSIGATILFQGVQQSPVPEPASLILLGSGLGALALVGWRRRK